MQPAALIENRAIFSGVPVFGNLNGNSGRLAVTVAKNGCQASDVRNRTVFLKEEPKKFGRGGAIGVREGLAFKITALIWQVDDPSFCDGGGKRDLQRICFAGPGGE